MKTFKFWVKTALVLASALGVIGIISIIVFQALYGWHTDILSPVEHLVKVLLLGGFKIAWVCVGLAIGKLLILVYTGEVLTKDPIKPSSKPHGIALYLVRHILRLLGSKGYKLTDDEYADIALYAQSVLESKNIPIPEKDEDLWKIIEPKVKQYTKPTIPEDYFDHKRGGNPTKAVEQQFSDGLGKEPWIGGVETPAYKSVKDRLTEVSQTPTQGVYTAKPIRERYTDEVVDNNKMDVEDDACKVSDDGLFVTVPILPNYAGNYRVECDGKYITLLGHDRNFPMFKFNFNEDEETRFDEMVLIPIVLEVRNANPKILNVTKSDIIISIYGSYESQNS